MTARGAEAQRDTVARMYWFRDFLGAISNSDEQSEGGLSGTGERTGRRGDIDIRGGDRGE